MRCLLLIPALDGDKLLEALEAYSFGQLYQKAGFILETFKDELSLPDTFFAECEKKSSASKTYLYERQEGFVLHERWKLFAPEDLRTIIDKGGLTMMQFDRIVLGRQAKEFGFVRDTFEKVCRLSDVLKFMEGNLVVTTANSGGYFFFP